ncbi:30S ribosomal protein S9 [Pseudobythopirellula maris]|uniref:Small ribosomal subunit protein uS9 n=1 Tax=Pseudobythopirellula maris TaxID=2527991 RepID=A0A5C5ZPL1_9BACT|nr:30S ribosomal protein S9 [Pseudobythopirellula maris]TWT88827.1 30S ribosomal protein S9 [Pseudobythopirellula maris]
MPTSEKVIDALGTGRRKTSIARVRIRPGTGQLTINKKTLDDYFTVPQDRNAVVAPLKHCEISDKVDVVIRTHGGGPTGQAGACMLGIARALVKYDSDLHDKLREEEFLTRDSRMKERKKPGLHGARRGTQFSKR